MIDNAIPRAVAEVLRQGAGLLRTLSDADYSRKVAVAYNASIGGHYRHSLDHFQSILDGIETDEVNYDCRKRDPRVETDRDFAWRETRRLLQTCDIVLPSLVNRPVQVRATAGYHNSGAAVVSSTFGRETLYAIAHAIHHYALIGVMCRLMELTLPANFGVAPSTVKHRVEQQVAAVG